jgi:hypothetical protein
LKQSLRKEQLRPNSRSMQNASDVVSYLKEAMNMPHAAYPLARRPVDRHFWEIPLEGGVDRSNPMNCRTVDGSRSMHSIRSVSHTNNVLLEARDYSCFCERCVFNVQEIPCPSTTHVSPWRLLTLEPTDSSEALQEPEETDPDWEAEPDEHFLASELQVGDHFAVIAERGNIENVDFFILQCTRTMYTVQDEQVEDSWGGVHERGDEVIEGMYYKRQGMSQNSFVLLRETGVACLYSHLVIASKFGMTMCRHKQKRKTSVYKLSKSALDHIRQILTSREQAQDLESESDDGSDTSDSNNEGSDVGSELDTDTEY